MPRFEYSALTRDGRTITGHVDAESRPLAIAELADAGRFVTSLDEPATYDRDAVEREVAPRSRPGSLLPWRSRVSHRALASMLRQLAVALQSGLPLLNAVRVVEQQAEQAPLAELAADLADRVQGGESFSAALAAHPGHFSEMQIAMARVGETAGVLDQTMGHLADFAERELDVREKVRSAAAYPLFVLGLAAVSIVIIMTWILPGIIDTVLADADPQTLPWITRVMMAASNFAASFSGLMTALLIGFGAYLLRKWAVTPTGRLAVHRMLLRLPVIGPAWRKVAVARFARTLGILTRSGIHCAPLAHMTFGTHELGGMTRFSFGPFLSVADVGRACDALAQACRHHVAAGV